MRLCLLALALSSLACARGGGEGAPMTAGPPVLTTAAPPVSRPPDLPRPRAHGTLVLRVGDGILVCPSDADGGAIDPVACRRTTFALPSMQHLMRDLSHDGRGRYVVPRGNRTVALFSPETHQSLTLPALTYDVVHEQYVSAFLDDGSAISFEFGKWGHHVRRWTAADGWKSLYGEREHATAFDFLADGRHLFVRHDLTSGHESGAFMDLIEGVRAKLFYVPAIAGSPPRIIAHDSVFYRPSFVDDGKRVAWLSPVDADGDTRTFALKSTSIESDTAPVDHERLTMRRRTGRGQGAGYARHPPSMRLRIGSPWIVVEDDGDEMGTAGRLGAVHVRELRHVEHRLDRGWSLFHGIDAVCPYSEHHRAGDGVVVMRGGAYAVEYAVLRVPTFEVVATVQLDPREFVGGADWLDE